ncbi:MAG: acyl carrier protein [Acidimicrobiales bacterium]
MPAETHQQRDEVTAAEIVDLLVAVLASSADRAGVGPDTPLADLGVDSDLALFDLGDVVAEEYGERSLGEIDVDELWSARTIGALAALFARRWTLAGENGVSGGEGI